MKLFNKKGNSLLEIIIALSIFSIVSATLAGVILSSFSLITRKSEMNEAVNIAREAMEVVRDIKNNTWNSLIYKRSAVNLVGNTWELSGEGTVEQIGKFSRTIDFRDVYRDENSNIVASTSADAILDVASKEVVVRVGWPIRGDTREIKRQTFFTNWSTRYWQQLDWTGGDGQTIWSSANKYGNDDGNITATSTGILLKQISTSTSPYYEINGYLESSAFLAPVNSNMSIVEWSATSTKTPDCPECEVRVQIKTALDLSGSPGAWTSTWTGPDGDDGDSIDYFATSTGTLLSTDHIGDRWIKYRIKLIGNGDFTPVFEWIKVHYN